MSTVNGIPRVFGAYCALCFDLNHQIYVNCQVPERVRVIMVYLSQ